MAITVISFIPIQKIEMMKTIDKYTKIDLCIV